jgi:pimeloyl-ACP methyl ester carboxylesterase
LLAAVYAALYPQHVERLVTFALPFAMRPRLTRAAVDYLVHAYGNVPAWLLRTGLNYQLPTRFHLALYLARDFGEPDLARSAWGPEPPLQRAIRQWIRSDVPLAGTIFREIMTNVYVNAELAESRLRVAERRVRLERITCPVLNIIGDRDRLVPRESSAAFVERVDAESRGARAIVAARRCVVPRQWRRGGIRRPLKLSWRRACRAPVGERRFPRSTGPPGEGRSCVLERFESRQFWPRAARQWWRLPRA